jgi:hypothetical protein
MPLPRIIYALGGVWLLLFIASFVTAQFASGANDAELSLNRLVSLLSWQCAAFVVAIALAWLTQRAAARGHEKIKLAGYAPLAVSVFLIGSFIAIIAYRFFVAPLLPS